MNGLKLAKAYFKQTQARIVDAEEALQKQNFPYALRLSQECVELSLKASLRLVGVDYPKVHDVSPILEDIKDRFPTWFSAEIDFMKETSTILASKREASLYGGETEMLGPDEIIGRNDAEDAVNRAKHMLELFQHLLKTQEQIKNSTA